MNSLSTVSINVDQRRHIGDVIPNQGRGFLRLLQWLRHDGDEGELLDPETRLDLLRPVPKQFRQPGDIAGRLCRSRTDCLSGTVDLLDDQVSTADTMAALL